MEKSEQIQPHAWILGTDVYLNPSSDGQLFESKFHNTLSGVHHLKRWCKEIKYCPICLSLSGESQDMASNQM